MFYLTTQSIHFINDYMATDWSIQIMRKEGNVLFNGPTEYILLMIIWRQTGPFR